ncbi:MAG: hypothetical protein LBL67_02495 [Coriobacteriales bacterium]|jgi:hypothetical protein|nr:hypothetical protein [Coriobacteriales bacterium]
MALQSTDIIRTQTPDAYTLVKSSFERFTVANTPINGKTECRRIFTKVINPLAFATSGHGTEHGHFSKGKITYDMLMYNRDNFRDIVSEKPKEMTRKEYEATIKFEPNPEYFKYESAKAKNILRRFNDEYRNGKSEVDDASVANELATQMHHIFPQSRFPEISMYLENIIALTPTQHLNHAHPSNKTSEISRSFQKTCLYAKMGSIKENLDSLVEEHIYTFYNFKYVLSDGLQAPDFMTIADGDYADIGRQIEVCYAGCA